MKNIKVLLSIFSFLVLSSAIFISCKKPHLTQEADTYTEPTLPQTPYEYSTKHSVNDNLATLGRVIFYDKILSVNNKVSCGSCHKQEFAFADNVQFNKGFDGMNLKRNSPSIQGLRGFVPTMTSFSNSGSPESDPNMFGFPTKDNQLPVLLFWDGRQKDVVNMVLNPILNHKEMNLPDFETLIQKMNTTSYYPGLFTNAFGDNSITKEKIAFALEGFIACLNTNSQFNAMPSGTINHIDLDGEIINIAPTTGNQQLPQANLTPLEAQGQFLFHTKYNCATCHDPSNTGSYGAVSNPSQMFNIGLDETYADNGLGAITKKAGDNGLFKVPTLKNISLTAPYMHDGRFSNLGEVIDHYSHGIQPNNNLSPAFVNRDGSPKKLNILASEKKALIAFLNTLKDEDFLTSPMYADPFKK